MHKNSTVIDTLGCTYESTVCMWYSWSVVQYVRFVRKINNFLLLFKVQFRYHNPGQKYLNTSVTNKRFEGMPTCVQYS